MKSKKQFFVPDVDELRQMVETPASKERTELRRFIVTLSISVIAAVAAIIAAVVSILTYIRF